MTTRRTIDLGNARLRWPTHVFASELDAMIRTGSTGEEVDHLIREAFDDHDELLRFLPGDAIFMGGAQRPTSRDQYLSELLSLANAGLVPEFVAPSARWRERKGVHRQTSESLPSLFGKALQELDELGYWDHAAHPPCVDDSFETLEHLGDVVERELGIAVDLKFLPRAYKGATENVKALDELTEDDVFELVEIFHDLAARPRSRYYHDYGHDWHHSDFAKGTGQAIYRWKINTILRDAQVAYCLAADGELRGRLVSAFDDGRMELLRSATTNAATEDKSRLDHAAALFLKRGSTTEDKRSALKNLADLLEKDRALLKAELFSKDEGALFEIANKFGIRHHTAQQQDDYDEAFLDWVFWWYLATVELAQRLAARKHESGSVV